MDSLFKGIFGGTDGDYDTRRSQVQDFVSRYDDGPPTEGFSDDEALRHYDEVAGHLSPEEYQEVATQAFERMSPEQRREFAQMLMRHDDDGSSPPIDSDTQYEDPRQLAQATSQVQQQRPKGLAELLGTNSVRTEDSTGGMGDQMGGGPGGMLGDLTGGYSQQRGYGQVGAGGIGGLVNNPVARAALGGIAAMAFRQLLNRR